MNEPLFSVLIANYNNGRYLQEAIDSVLAQTYTNWEIIIVDDKSTDNSFEIYDKYRTDSRFHIYYNEKNKGRGYTKKKCVCYANGDICGYLDPDDMLLSSALEKMVFHHKMKPECSLVYSTLYYYSKDKGNYEVPKNIGTNDDSFDFCLSPNVIVSHFATFKRQKLHVENLDESLNVGVDVDLYLNLEEQGYIYHFSEPLYQYRMDNSNSAMIQVNGESREIGSCQVMLNAICRRIKEKSDLFVRNVQGYENAFWYWYPRLYRVCRYHKKRKYYIKTFLMGNFKMKNFFKYFKLIFSIN